VNIFGEIRDRISGPERTFVVESVERGEETTRKVYVLVGGSTWLGHISYSREVPVRLVYIKLNADGIEHEIDTTVKSYVLGESFDGLVSLQLERLEQMVGRTVKIRAKEPYDSTLEKLARRG